MLRGAEVLREEPVQEVVDTGWVEPLVRSELRVGGEGPPLAVERLVGPEGPTAPPVILVHGLAQNRYTWRVQGRSLAGFLAAAGYEVLNLELRGHGRSRELGSGNASSFDEYVHDVHRVVRGCAVAPFAIGHSLGGSVLAAASTQLELVGLVTLGAVLTFARGNRFLRALTVLSLRWERLLTLAPLRVRTAWLGRLIGDLYGITEVAGYDFPLAGWVPGSMEEEVVRERLALGFDWTSIEVWMEMCRWAADQPFPYADELAHSEVPLLVLAGDHDRLAPPVDAYSLYEASGSDDRTFMLMEAFEHGSHWGHLDLVLGHRAPGIVWSEIAAWLEARS